MTTHLGHTGDQSPFAILEALFKTNVDAAADLQVDGLTNDLSIIFQEILRDVKSMIRSSSTHPSEYWVREAVRDFVKTDSVKLDKINSTVKAIESQYSFEHQS